MSATPPADEVRRRRAAEPRERARAGTPYRSRDSGELRLRRREALRERHLLRRDVALGAIAGIVLLIVTPGVAYAAILALLALLVCGFSLAVGRRRARRRRDTRASSRDRLAKRRSEPR